MRLLTTLLTLFLTAPVAAQDYWRQAEGPYGGTIVYGMTATPEGFYAATVGGLFHSSDAGRTWVLDGKGIAASGIDARELLRLADGSELLATYGGGIYKRWPGSDEWQSVNAPDAWIQAVAEAADGTVYAATIRGILRSENAGSSWLAMNVAERASNVKDVAFHAGVLYAATPDGVYKSEDRGTTWEWASAGMTTFDTDMLFVTSTGDVYAGTSPIDGGCTLFRTRSSGRIWTCVQPQTDPIRAGGMAEDQEGRLYFGGFRFVYRSDDEGSTWIPTANTNTTVHGVAALGSAVMAGTYGRGILRSENRGSSWEKSNQGLQSAIRDLAIGPDGGIYVATLGGVFQSNDLGASWRLLDEEGAAVRPAYSLAFDDEGRLLDGTLNGLFRLNLTTQTWDALGPPGRPPIRDVLSGPDGEVFVGYHEGVYHLRGQNWSSYPLIGPDQAARNVIAVGLDDDGTVFAGGTYDSFMRPAGATGWVRLTSGATPYFESQVFARDAGGDLYAGTRYFGVMKSTDGGQTWSPMTGGLSGSEDIRAIAFDAAGEMYIGSFGNGIYRYNTMRRSFEPLNGGMENARRVTALAFDHQGNAVAGTYGSGLWVHDAGATSVEEPVSALAGPLLQLYPNPTRGQAIAAVALGNSGTATIEVFDLLGRRVQTASTYVSAGSRAEISLDTSTLSPGVYLVRVSTAGRSTTARLTAF